MSILHELTKPPARGQVKVRLLSFSASLPAALPFNRESRHGQ